MDRQHELERLAAILSEDHEGPSEWLYDFELLDVADILEGKGDATEFAEHLTLGLMKRATSEFTQTFHVAIEDFGYGHILTARYDLHPSEWFVPDLVSLVVLDEQLPTAKLKYSSLSSPDGDVPVVVSVSECVTTTTDEFDHRLIDATFNQVITAAGLIADAAAKQPGRIVPLS